MTARRTKRAPTGPQVLRLPEDLTIITAADTKQVLDAAVEAADGRLDLDASTVVEFDTAGLQLLLAAQQAAWARGGGIRITSPAPCVSDVLHLTGISGDLLPVADNPPGETS